MSEHGGFREVADRVYVLRYPVLDVNVTLVTAPGAALVVDTLSTAAQAGELAEAIRRITRDPLIVVNTHHHFDHCFGNATLAGPGSPVWAHEEAARELRDNFKTLQHFWYEAWLPSEPELATGLAEVTVRVPDRLVRAEATVDLAGRPVRLHHLGRGHTAGDLVVTVPDAGVVLAGDLVEEGAPPSYGKDAFPLEWPDTVAALLRLVAPDGVVMPGHGAPVDRAFVTAQHRQLAELDRLIRQGHADGAAAAEVAARSPFGAAASLGAVHRGYASLGTTIDG
ncbi:glyoxylase-like metal-dependent hydrolase (beta-lactamase superfamily II) [Actinoplanes octamycinicus]|uniref:Glyoxylase-like metal-dependent hydrolase (Beta-lactamase superfamily II) n=1 Tax=Actinoplanes octamycinicus TaxID=135948 RepID=A0A7W7H2H3_9ACTN|nr:MBL fold metallo-hydrolase [Actinoplanes octamycinicus]MBB4742703.1 glyoxylase-like metal-dependent hydrolase (beta-lactamase superfamily II) [Actinoplanes octamycinicus]GIE63004.1 MBL fold metallo-hydrolase [Actinoplanes octamycinicus]